MNEIVVAAIVVAFVATAMLLMCFDTSKRG